MPLTGSGRWQLGNVRDNQVRCRGFYKRFYCKIVALIASISIFLTHGLRRNIIKEGLYARRILEELIRCLKPGGVIKIATDHAEYFEWITQVMDDGRLTEIEFFPTSGAAAEKGEWAGTNFERKYLKEGRQIFTLAKKLVAGS